jgi:hypothetical protein
LILKDTTAPGGSSRRVVIPVALSNSVGIRAFTGTIHDPSGVLQSGTAAAPFQGGIATRDPEMSAGGFQIVSTAEGKLTFAVVSAFIRPRYFEIGQDVTVADIITCLKAGTPAGEYPLLLELAELASGGSTDSSMVGRAIYPPTLVSATLVVENDVTDGSCDLSDPPPPQEIKIRFMLADKAGVPGGNVSVPFRILSDRASQGFSYSIHFDEAVLQATGTDKIFTTPSGTPYEFEKFELNNDTGFLVGAAILSLSDTGDVIPPGSADGPGELVLEFDFHIDALASVGTTPIEFRDGGRGTGGPVRNKLIAGGQEITPDAATSFVFVNGLLNIVPDSTPFVRGDSNFDESIDISDAKFTLSFLFTGGTAPPCPDSTDANDDGKIDISDPIATLQFLFTGETKLPPPRVPGLDPTPDGLICRP